MSDTKRNARVTTPPCGRRPWLRAGALACAIALPAVLVAAPPARDETRPAAPEARGDDERAGKPDKADRAADKAERAADKADRKDGPKAAAGGLGGFLRRFRPGGAGPAAGATSGPTTPLPEASWDEVAAFMTGHSPAKFAMFEKMPDKPLKQTTKAGIITRYQELKRLQSEDRDLYAIEVERIRIEDDVFVALRNFHLSPSPGEKDAARASLRTAVAKLVDNRQAERTHRFKKIEHQLERFASNRDAIINDQTESILRDGLLPAARRRAAEEGGKKNRKAGDAPGVGAVQ